MGSDKYRLSSFRKTLNQSPKTSARYGRHTSRGLIQKHNLRIMQHRRRQRNMLLGPAWQVRHQRILVAIKRNEFEELFFPPLKHFRIKLSQIRCESKILGYSQ